MSIQSEINRIAINVFDAYSAVAAKGGTIPSGANSNGLASAIRTIPELEGIPVKPVTSAEYESLSTEEKNDETVWLVTDKDGMSSNGSSSSLENVYSTEETRIGTYMDAPLYRILVSVTVPSGFEKLIYTMPNANIISVTGLFSDANGAHGNAPGFFGPDHYICLFWVAQNIYCSTSAYAGSQMVLTIEYTKHTD